MAIKPNSWLLIFILISGLLLSHGVRRAKATEVVSVPSFYKNFPHGFQYKFREIPKRAIGGGRFHGNLISSPERNALPHAAYDPFCLHGSCRRLPPPSPAPPPPSSALPPPLPAPPPPSSALPPPPMST